LFGIPATAPEGAYAFFTGKLQMELGGISVGNMTFRVKATFEPNLGLIARHFTHSTEYLHGEISVETARGKGMMTVGFPWALSSVRLYSNDPQVDKEGAGVARAILEKYSKYVRENRRTAPSREDPTRRVSLISDGVVVIAIEEGIATTKIGQTHFLEIEYSAYPQGPLDEMSAGDGEFMKFAEAISNSIEPVMSHHEVEPEPVGSTPF
jgi:hypothetical protein